MLPRERVIDVIEHRKPDRIPIYGWVRENLSDKICAEFGSIEAFEDHYEFDFAHLFGGPKPYPDKITRNAWDRSKPEITPAELLTFEMNNPSNISDYENLRKDVNHHKKERGRFVYVQTPGIFECLNEVFGFENHLAYMLIYENDLKSVYQRQAEWNRNFAMQCLDLGVDMIHVSDDWGSQHGLLFNPDLWWKLIYPFHKITCDAVKDRGAYISLHSCGNFSKVVDGVIELGYNVVHPWQESAGMDLSKFREMYIDKFTVMGGLDVQSTIGFGNYERLKSEITRVINMFRDGGLLLCTSHFIQEHCTIDELKFAYDLIYEQIRL